MAVQFPGSLSGVYPDPEGFQRVIGPSKSESRFGGATLFKKINFKFPDRWQISLIFTENQLATFEAWYRDELKEGLEEFIWRDPVTLGRKTFKVLGSFGFDLQGLNRYRVTLNLEEVEGGD